MVFYPVIMCGGAGTRLWPASRPALPKQFINLAGNRSLFQDTAERVAALAQPEGRLIVIAGVAHADTIAEQLLQIGLDAQVLLEPQARDSAAAMAAAAVWVGRHDPQGIIVFVASDHYIPDVAAFRKAAKEAAKAAKAGRIVTLGIKPTEPSSAYGYLKPSGTHLSPIQEFREKPDVVTAMSLIAKGYVWNSGNFIVSAETLTQELAIYAPAVLAAALDSLPDAASGAATQTLGIGFLAAPKISIDYAVMERTQRASVLEVDFAWSDLGAWDAVAASGEGSTGISILDDAERILTRAPDGVLVVAMGVSDLAIVVEADAVLVCSLAKSQEIKGLVNRIRLVSPQHLDFAKAPAEGLVSGARGFADWLRLRALPVWSTLGFGSDGGFIEALTLAGQGARGLRRSRVQTRQIFTYAQAGQLGWQGPWKSVVAAALDRLRSSYLTAAGTSHSVLAEDWSVLDDRTSLYDQAFVLFALCAAHRSGSENGDVEGLARRLRERLVEAALPNGAMLEGVGQPYQSNAHMHLLEAAMAWSEISTDPAWRELADRIVGLAVQTFIDAEGGFLREFFDEDWKPAAGDDGSLVEPGHQFEWAWLLARHAKQGGDTAMLATARKLYAVGRKGVAHRPPVAVDALSDDLSLRSSRARLWPQTEWLKASLILAETAEDTEREALLRDAASALRALKLYFTDDGIWRDKRLESGDFIEEPAPASSFYHIMVAFDQLGKTLKALGLDGGVPIDLN